MKKKLGIMLAMLMVLMCITPCVNAAQIADTGACGENASYTLYDDGRLVITGTGAIWDFAFEHNDQITSLEIADGITAIGVGAFADCKSLTGTVVIPDSITSLCGSKDPLEGNLGAFDGCTSLNNIVIGSGVTSMPYGVLSNCQNLRSVSMPDGITVIAPYALSFCERLTYVEIPATVTHIGAMAFVNDFSLTTVVFEGSAPTMDNPFYCGSFNTAGFYPYGDISWENADDIAAMASLQSLVPYTTDSQGDIIPVAPSDSDAEASMNHLQTKYPAGSLYSDNYSYIINGNYITGYGSEAFAFQVSDALCDYLPMSEVRPVNCAQLNIGDVLYLDGECCTVTGISGQSITVAGVTADDTIYYDRTLTSTQIDSAIGVRARCGVSPYPGLLDPALGFQLEDLPTQISKEQTVYETIVSLLEIYPEGMPYTSKNHFDSKTESPVWTENGMPVNMSMYGHGCSAFGFMVSDMCFGNLPARYLKVGTWSYDTLKVGDSLIGLGHQVIVLEVHDEYVIIVEGNYDETIHWGRMMSREEVLADFDLYTRYPEGYPFTDVETDAFYTNPVSWAVKKGITNGLTETTFGPNAVCSRAQIVTFLWRAAGCPEPAVTENPFVDVTAGSFYEKAVLWAVENGITTGTSANYFSPDAACSRATVVTFLYRAAGSPAVENSTVPFTDVPNTWYTTPVLWAVENGITNGISATQFGPDVSCSRAQIVTFLYRAYN